MTAMRNSKDGQELIRFILENKKWFSPKSLTWLGGRVGFQLAQTEDESLVVSFIVSGLVGLCGYTVSQKLNNLIREQFYSPNLSQCDSRFFKKSLSVAGAALGLYLALNSGTLLASSGLRFAQTSLLTAVWGACGHDLGKLIDAKINQHFQPKKP